MRALNEIDWKKAKILFAEDRLTLSEKLANKLDQYPHAKIILNLLAAGCVLTLAAVSPGSASLLGIWKSFSKRRFRQAIYRLRQQKFVKITGKGEQQTVIITIKGLNKSLSYRINNMRIKEPKKWDGKWRLVIFDIQDKKRRYRDIFRNKVKALGLWPLQKSVYVYPYPCFNQIEFLRQIFGVGLEVKYIVAQKIEDDEYLRNHFRI